MKRKTFSGLTVGWFHVCCFVSRGRRMRGINLEKQINTRPAAGYSHPYITFSMCFQSQQEHPVEIQQTQLVPVEVYTSKTEMKIVKMYALTSFSVFPVRVQNRFPNHMSILRFPNRKCIPLVYSRDIWTHVNTPKSCLFSFIFVYAEFKNILYVRFDYNCNCLLCARL